MGSAQKSSSDHLQNRPATGRPGTWPKGVSGNPKGRPPKAEGTVVGELRAILGEKLEKRTRARRIAETIVKRAEEGDVSAARLCFAYTDGLPVERVKDVTPPSDYPAFRMAVFRILGRHPELRSEVLDELGEGAS